MKRLENKIGILQHKVKNTNQLKIKNQNLRLEKMRLLKAVERRDKKIKELEEAYERIDRLWRIDSQANKNIIGELKEKIDKAIEYIEQQMNMYDNIEDERNDLLNILKGE